MLATVSVMMDMQAPSHFVTYPDSEQASGGRLSRCFHGLGFFGFVVRLGLRHAVLVLFAEELHFGIHR